MTNDEYMERSKRFTTEDGKVRLGALLSVIREEREQAEKTGYKRPYWKRHRPSYLAPWGK